MTNETSKISELNSATRIKESALIPVVNTNTETNNIDLSTLRSALWFENAYADIASGLAGTKKGESFFVYEDESKTTVVGFYNQGGDSYTPLLNEKNEQLKYFSNDYPLKNYLETLSSILSLKTDQISFLEKGIELSSLDLISTKEDRRLFLVSDLSGVVLGWEITEEGCILSTTEEEYYLTNFVFFAGSTNSGSNISVEEIIPHPGEKQTVVEISFGGVKNKGIIGLDSRGRLSLSVVVDGLTTVSDLKVPFTEGTGYFNGPYQDVIVRFPIKGMADDDTTHGLLLSYDKVKGLPILYAVSPLQYDKEGLVSQGTKYGYGTPLYHQVRELAQLDSIGRSLGDSFDAWFIFNNSAARYHRLAVINNPTTNKQAVSFTGILTIGDWTTNSTQPYFLTVNSHNISANSQNIISNLKWRIKLTQIHGDLSTVNSDSKPQVGLRITSTGVMEVWLKIPPNSSRLSFMSINSGNRDQIKLDFDLLYTRYKDILDTAPDNVIWKTPGYSYTSDNSFIANDGSVHRFLGGSIIRVGNPTIFTKRTEILSEDFIQGGTLHAYKNNHENMAGVTVTVDSNNIYTVTGVVLRWDTIRFIAPVGFYDQSQYVVKLESTGTKTFSFSVRTKTYNVANTAISGTNLTSGEITVGTSSPIAIPDYLWVDISVQW